ncbi:hypothetical protein D3A96_13945 [Robertkochia marina]|nr:hypothetical protein D3A96_13945 [Robertkochia marina]
MFQGWVRKQKVAKADAFAGLGICKGELIEDHEVILMSCLSFYRKIKRRKAIGFGGLGICKGELIEDHEVILMSCLSFYRKLKRRKAIGFGGLGICKRGTKRLEKVLWTFLAPGPAGAMEGSRLKGVIPC